ncbi:hypothetical protein PSTG_13706 [Puccinia striiformis f. sp. tritici PST-78]|uniref:Uncharacterized protein n=1 Tax=Puccinia striiformis f. sp. tritici PST-78 TaxID=1165861 RepID=A0A0L0V0V6_9BASI|nr:hypothetical protein PSTG_13706 [Puccinia striiformis f. sp. tritici PST-78]
MEFSVEARPEKPASLLRHYSLFFRSRPGSLRGEWTDSAHKPQSAHQLDRIAVVGALGSAAYAAKGAFEPYFDVCMQHITPFLSLKAEGEEQELRGVAQDTVGTSASAVGKEKFRPFLDACLNIAFEAIDLNSSSLRECSMIFFGTAHQILRIRAEEDDGSVLPSEMIKGFQPVDDEEDEVEEDPNFVDIDDVDLDDDDLMKTATAIAVKKSVTADASIKSLTPLLAHFYPTTCKAATTTLLSFITIAHQITNPPKFEPGIANIHIPGDVCKVVDLIVPEIMSVWRSEDECDVVIDLCSSLSSVTSTVGADLDETCSLIIAILERKWPAQLDGDFEDASATGDFLEVESSLIGCAADLLSTTIHASHRLIETMPLSLWQRSSTVLGPPFEALPLKQDFTESSKCFEALFELIQQSHPLVEAHFEHILAVFSHVLQNSAPTVSEEKAMIPSETRDQLVALKRFTEAAVQQPAKSLGLLTKCVDWLFRSPAGKKTSGFSTKEAIEKLEQEAELKLREKEGRPLPTNEAEKMLKILETGRNPNSFLGAKHHTANLPNIIVPIPLTLVLQHQQSHH